MPEKKPLIIKPETYFSLNFALVLGILAKSWEFRGTAGSVNAGQLRRDVSGSWGFKP